MEENSICILWGTHRISGASHLSGFILPSTPGKLLGGCIRMSPLPADLTVRYSRHTAKGQGTLWSQWTCPIGLKTGEKINSHWKRSYSYKSIHLTQKVTKSVKNTIWNIESQEVQRFIIIALKIMFWCCCYWVSIHLKYVDALTGEHSAESQSKFTMQPWLMNLLSPAVLANLRRQVTLLFPQVSKYYPDFLRGGQMFNLKTIFYTVKFRWK